jgi:hypothetical protein
VRNDVERSGGSLSNEAFDLGEDLFDRIEVGRVFGKKQEASAGGLNGVSHGFSFVGAKIVEDDNVVGFESRDEELLDIGAKALAVDRTVEHAGRLDAVVAQRGQEGRGLPFALREGLSRELGSGRTRVEGLGSCSGRSRRPPILKRFASESAERIAGKRDGVGR